MAQYNERDWNQTKDTEQLTFTAGEDLPYREYVREFPIGSHIVESTTQALAIGYVLSPKGVLAGEKVDVHMLRGLGSAVPGGGGGSGTVTDVTGINSVTTTPSPIVGSGTVELVNDAASPGANQVYGTDDSGVKGWYSSPSVPTSFVVPVRVATTAALAGTPTYNNGVAGVGATLTRSSNGALAAQDGITLIVSDRLLVKNQAAQLQNGVYEVTDLGSAGTPYILTRTTDSDATTEFENQVVGVAVGTTNSGKLFEQTTTAPVVGTNNIVYAATSTIYQRAIQFRDEGVNLGAAATVNVADFVGAGVTATRVGNTLTVTIPGGSSALTEEQVAYGDPFNIMTSSADLKYVVADKQFQVGPSPTEGWGGTPTHSIALNDGTFAFQGVNSTGGGAIDVLAIGRGAIQPSVAAINAMISAGGGGTYNVIGIGIDQTVTGAVGNDSTIVIGCDVIVTGDGNLLVGSNSQILGTQNFVFANSSGIMGSGPTTGNVIAGGSGNSFTDCNYCIATGYGSTMSSSYGNITIGGFHTINSGFSSNIILGWNTDVATSLFGFERNNTFVAGGDNAVFFGDNSIIDVYFGAGSRSIAPNTLVHLRSTDAYDTADTNGTAWNFHQGLGTGNAVGLSYKWYTPDATASGSTQQAETEKMELDVLGQLKLNLYGAGTFIGTATKALAVDATGNVIEIAVGGASSFADNVFYVYDDGDATKIINFSLAGQSTSTIASFVTSNTIDRQYTLPDATGTILLETNVATVTNKTIDTTNVIKALDSTFGIYDNLDQTKVLAFQASGITTATTRTIRALDLDGYDVLSFAPLTDTRIPYWSTTGLRDSANLVWDNTNSQLTLLGAGTASLPTIAIGTAANGIYYPTTNTLGFTTNGTQRFQLDATSFNSITSGGGYIKRAAGTAAAPAFAFNSTINTGMWLDGTSLSFAVAGVDKVGITSAGALTLFNPANTFEYSITPAAIAANRTLNLPLITATDTLASLGLAQTFSANQTFSADLIKSGSIFVAGGNGVAANKMTCGLYTTNSPTYKLTNAGGTVSPFLYVTNNVSAAGTLGFVVDSTNGVMFTHANGSVHIAGAAFKLTNLDNTAGSEDADLSLYMQAAGAAVTEQFVWTNDGRMYGKSIHNNAGAVTGTTNQYVASGTYTATLTNTTNVAASTAYLAQWMRVGNVVTVSGKVDIDITTTLLASDMGMSLPIASAFTNERDCGGTAISDSEQTANIRIKADATNDRAQFVWTGQVGTGNLSYSFHFTYLVL